MRDFNQILSELGLQEDRVGDDDALASAASEVAAAPSREQSFMQVVGQSLATSAQQVADERVRREEAEKKAASTFGWMGWSLAAILTAVLLMKFGGKR